MSSQMVLPSASLPSSNSAARLVAGDPWAPLLIARDLLSRSLLIGTGMYLAGERQNLVRNALAGSAAIEVFVIGWIALNARDR